MKRSTIKLSKFAIPLLFILGNILYLAVVEDIRHKLNPTTSETAFQKLPPAKDSLNPVQGSGSDLISAGAGTNVVLSGYENTKAK